VSNTFGALYALGVDFMRKSQPNSRGTKIFNRRRAVFIVGRPL
jgi:hypothetical protein